MAVDLAYAMKVVQCVRNCGGLTAFEKELCGLVERLVSETEVLGILLDKTTQKLGEQLLLEEENRLYELRGNGIPEKTLVFEMVQRGCYGGTICNQSPPAPGQFGGSTGMAYPKVADPTGGKSDS
jgi:hypothetical protein